MATWTELSQECLLSAQRLFAEGLLRRCVSSAYYAAYSAVTSELVQRKVTFAHGWNNPSHEQLPDLILNQLTLPKHTRYRLNNAIRFLRQARENADYRPTIVIDRSRALDSLRYAVYIIAVYIIKVLEAKHG